MSEAKLDLLLSKMDDFQLQLNSQGEHIRQLIHIVGATNAKLEELTEDVHQLKEDVADLKDDVSVLKQDVAILKKDVSVLKDDVFVLKKDSGQLKSGQETLLGIQKEQQKILERLSVRSISHEADIAELRKI